MPRKHFSLPPCVYLVKSSPGRKAEKNCLSRNEGKLIQIATSTHIMVYGTMFLISVRLSFVGPQSLSVYGAIADGSQVSQTGLIG